MLRFISYYCQIDLVQDQNPGRILEVGIGNKTVSTYLKTKGYDVTTCDLNPDLEPDVVADVREMPFEDDSFDVVMACEILEHLPWEDSLRALAEIRRVSKGTVILSLPAVSLFFECVIKFPMIRPWFGKPFWDLFLGLPWLTFKKASDNHYWEIGSKGYPLSKIRKSLREQFSIERELRPVLNSRHRLFVLKNKS